MKRCRTAVVVATALALAAPLGATGEVGKTPLSIRTVVEGNLLGSGTGRGTFTLDLGSSSDAGKLTLKYSYGGGLRRAADGQYFRPVGRTETLRGKHGTLVIRSVGRQFPVGVLKEDDEVWTGTWSIVRGTGRYVGLTGGGGLAGIIQISGHGLTSNYSTRYEGLVSRA